MIDGCVSYLSMLGLKLIHVSERGLYKWYLTNKTQIHITWINEHGSEQYCADDKCIRQEAISWLQGPLSVNKNIFVDKVPGDNGQKMDMYN